MAARHWFATVGMALALLTTAALAQTAPVPMPRPLDRMPPGMGPDGAAAPVVGEPGLAETATQAAAALAAELQPVHLSAQITDNGTDIPQGLVWRIFDAKTDTTGELALAAKSDDAEADFNLAPGEYVVHVAYGRAQASDTLVVTEGKNEKKIVLNAGALRLNAAVTGDVAIPINLLHFDIFTAGAEDSRTLVAQDMSPNDIVTLNAGTYHVVSYFGAVNAVVRADLRVEPGQLTDVTLYHRAEQVAFKLVTEAGGEAVADVEWTVKTADGVTVFSDISAFPATVLAEGDYMVLAKRGDTVYNREFQVQPGAPREVEVLTSVYASPAASGANG